MIRRYVVYISLFVLGSTNFLVSSIFLFSSIFLGSAILWGDEPKSQEVLFETKVRPLLSQHCVECHGTKEQSGGLRFDSSTAITKGGSSGPIVVPGDPDKSPLVRAIRYTDPDLETERQASRR